jgi:hypothetical protein
MERLEKDNSVSFLVSGPLILLIIGSLISPFSFIQLIIIGAVYFLLWRLIGKERAYVSVWIGTILMWSSIFLTYTLTHTGTPLTLNNIIAVSGFPLTALYYPVPPMGSDIPPWQMWPAFFADYIFWIIIGVLVSKFVAGLIFKKTKYGRPLIFALPMIGFGFMLAGFLHIILKFD